MSEVTAPATRYEKEGLIKVRQRDFSAGLFYDMPASQVPENGYWRNENFINRGDRLDVRSGCRLWSSTTLPPLVGRTGYTASSSVLSTVRTIEKTLGADFTSDDVGNWFVHDDGKHERIIEYVDANTIKTRTQYSSAKSSTAGWVHGPVNCWYYHKAEQCIILQIDTRLFVAEDLSITSWIQAFCSSYDQPNDAISVGGEFEDSFIMWNSKGIYKLRLGDGAPYIFYRANTRVPNVKITDSGSQSSTTPYGRRRTYSMIRLSGSGNRDRTSSGVEILQESGTCLGQIVGDQYYDYGESWTADPIGSTNSESVGTLTVPVDPISLDQQNHWTHYAVYATLHLGSFGVDPLNPDNKNSQVLYIWLADIPIAKVLTASRSGTTLTATEGAFEKSDVGCSIEFVDGTTDTIASYTSSTVVETTGTGTVSSQGVGIGGGSMMTASQTVSGSETIGNATVTRTAGYEFTSSDVRKTLFWSNGSRGHIVRYVDANTVEVAESSEVTSGSAMINPVSRSFNDTIDDAALRSRINSYTCESRLWSDIPLANTGAIVPGFIFAGVRGKDQVYYGQIPEEYSYLLGYHHPTKQKMTLKDSLTSFSAFNSTLIARCRNSTWSIPVNSFKTEKIKSAGVSVSIVVAQNPIDQVKGAIDFGGVAMNDDDTSEIVVTSEPALRTFDGSRYGANLAEDRIQSQLAALQTAYAMEIHPALGVILYGRSDA